MLMTVWLTLYLRHFQTLELRAQPFPDPICVWPYQACFQPIYLRVALSTY